VFPSHTIDDAEVTMQLVSAHHLLERGDDPLDAETALRVAFATLLTRHARPAPTVARVAAEPARVAAMQRLLALDPHFDDAPRVTLTALADAVGLSPYHALRVFVRAVGMPPHAWRNQLRLARAVGMLRRGTPVGTVAAHCGYADQSHFTRQFKRAYGVAPGHWQRA